MSAIGSSLHRPGLPTSAADEMADAHRRTRRTRLALAAAALAMLAACFFLARGLDVLPTTYFAESTGGVVVLDMSTSVDAVKAQRAERVLRTFAQTEGRVGLVAFSDSAYEMFPPDTRSEELRPLLRFFEMRGGERPDFRRFSRRQRDSTPAPREMETPWSLSFRGGTRISTGLQEARYIVERERDPSLSVLLLSDLDNSGFDTSTLTEELVSYRRAGIDLRVIPLFPAPEDRALFEQLVGKGSLVKDVERIRNTRIHQQQTLVGAFPWLLFAVVAVLLALLAVNERWLGRLAWSVGR
jgi:Mg-chelatase subunit ChlD